MPSASEVFPINRTIGGALAAIGLAYAASPWLFGFGGSGPAVAERLAAGLLLAAVGVVRLARGPARALWLSAAAGGWMLFAPRAVGYADMGLAPASSLFAGAFTLALSGAGLLAARAGLPARRLTEGPDLDDPGPGESRPRPAGVR